MKPAAQLSVPMREERTKSASADRRARLKGGSGFACLGRYVGCLKIMAEAYRVHNADTRVLPLRQPAGPIPGAAPLPRGSPITIRGDVPYRCRAGGEAPERQKKEPPSVESGDGSLT